MLDEVEKQRNNAQGTLKFVQHDLKTLLDCVGWMQVQTQRKNTQDALMVVQQQLERLLDSVGDMLGNVQDDRQAPLVVPKTLVCGSEPVTETCKRPRMSDRDDDDQENVNRGKKQKLDDE
ncbi:hypothetical protein AURDEDRAFT_178077 [Auricularia subglabra TFB-10046 SS5]|nr:hypothetical protein AURDEDRAFT_178077 [Auricularia subglabra TFB-10046 SS5]